MQIQIKSVEFVAFKGGNPINLSFGPGINTLIGMNGSGKSTVLDAMIWCLFGKNFTDQKKFELIPLNPDGSVQQVSPSVTMKMLINDALTVFSRRMDGSKTICEINEIPCQTLKVFDDVIAGYFGTEERFKMFTMPLFFTEALHWTKQRELLMQFFPAPDPADVLSRMTAEKIRFSKELVSAMAVMEPADYIAKHDKVLKDAELQKAKISAQIQLLDDQLEGNQTIDQVGLEAERDTLRQRISTLEAEIKTITENNQSIRSTMQRLQSVIDDAIIAKSRIEKNAIFKRDEEIYNLNYERQAKSNKKAELIKSYREKSAAIDDTCSMCLQLLPAASIANTKAKQAEALKLITDQGTVLNKEIITIENRLQELESQKMPALQSEDQSKVDVLNHTIKDAKANMQALDPIREVPNFDFAAQDRLDEISKALSRIDVHKENIERKKKLEAEARQLNQEVETHTLAITEASRFAFYRSSLVVEAVNRHFRTISVKVLDIQKNGTAKETFEITSNGVPYSGLNKTGKLIASLELCEFLKSSLKVESPVIIDDIENYPDLDLSTISGQLIVAYASRRQQLRVVNQYPQDIKSTEERK